MKITQFLKGINMLWQVNMNSSYFWWSDTTHFNYTEKEDNKISHLLQLKIHNGKENY